MPSTGRPLRLVVADDPREQVTALITVYEPDATHGWDPASGWARSKERDHE
ncbi:MAG: hypothetical protein ACRD0K_28835 [Egibacteraceae bacterium]